MSYILNCYSSEEDCTCIGVFSSKEEVLKGILYALYKTVNWCYDKYEDFVESLSTSINKDVARFIGNGRLLLCKFEINTKHYEEEDRNMCIDIFFGKVSTL